jgi:hypothetical protein
MALIVKFEVEPVTESETTGHRRKAQKTRPDRPSRLCVKRFALKV